MKIAELKEQNYQYKTKLDMENKTKKQVNNINNSNEKLLLSDVSNSFCDLYKKMCMGGLCSVTPFPEKCEYLKQNDC